MNKTVESNRTLYIPSEFAKESLIYLQEVGSSKTLANNTSSREKLDSYLLFIVENGNGTLDYQNKIYKLDKGACVFIDCHYHYSHTSDNWTIKWVHFNGSNVKNIYDKYVNRDGLCVFKSNNYNKYDSLINEIQIVAKSNDYIKDMIIFNKLSELLSILMLETVYEKSNKQTHLYDISIIKEYIDSNYLKQISLDELSKIFFINKYYLTRLFKNTYGLTINNYILNKKITKAKELLRYSDLNIESIARECGINDANYFSRLFKQVEGITPKEYMKMW